MSSVNFQKLIPFPPSTVAADVVQMEEEFWPVRVLLPALVFSIAPELLGAWQRLSESASDSALVWDEHKGGQANSHLI
jgi:hypothetical protein